MFCPRLGATWKQLSRWWMAISTMGSPPSLLVWLFKWPEEWTGKRAQLQKVEGRKLGSFMEENKTLNLRAEVWKNPGADETEVQGAKHQGWGGGESAEFRGFQKD